MKGKAMRKGADRWEGFTREELVELITELWLRTDNPVLHKLSVEIEANLERRDPPPRPTSGEEAADAGAEDYRKASRGKR
jgi:hypothetical protein